MAVNPRAHLEDSQGVKTYTWSKITSEEKARETSKNTYRNVEQVRSKRSFIGAEGTKVYAHPTQRSHDLNVGGENVNVGRWTRDTPDSLLG